MDTLSVEMGSGWELDTSIWLKEMHVHTHYRGFKLIESGTAEEMQNRFVLQFTLTLMDTSTLKCVEWLKHISTGECGPSTMPKDIHLSSKDTTFMEYQFLMEHHQSSICGHMLLVLELTQQLQYIKQVTVHVQDLDLQQLYQVSCKMTTIVILEILVEVVSYIPTSTQISCGTTLDLPVYLVPLVVTILISLGSRRNWDRQPVMMWSLDGAMGMPLQVVLQPPEVWSCTFV